MGRSSVTSLDLRNNRLSQLPDMPTSYRQTKVKVWLKGNPLQCSCDMIWLINWLAGDGKHIVQDYQEVTCGPGKQVGQPIYLVKPLDMACYPMNATLFISMLLLGGVITFFLVALGLVVRSTDFRWLMYKNFGQLVGDPDKDEVIDKMEFDGFISFR